MTITPGVRQSAGVEQVAEPPESDGSVLVRTLAIGVCGTDREIVAGEHGSAPPGATRLILGHESLGRVESAPPDSGFAAGDLVVGIVRRPDAVPCVACAVGEWDMCRNGLYTERGIKDRNGYGSERFRIEPEFAVKVDPAVGHLGVLLEPASVLAKAWDHIVRIGLRAAWRPKTVLITGAGPIGLLAALMGAQRGLDVHVYDRHQSGPKPALVSDLRATYHSDAGSVASLAPDILIECSGAPTLVREVLGRTAAAGIICLTGVSAPGHEQTMDFGRFNREMVLGNEVVLGTVNANRSHYEIAAAALAQADKTWLSRLITRRVPLDRWTEALEPKPDDVKVVVDFA